MITYTRTTGMEEETDVGAVVVVEEVIMVDKGEQRNGKEEQHNLGRIEEEATATPMKIVHISEATAAHRDLTIKTKLHL